VEHVYLVYRRTRRYMPADAEELDMAVEDGVEFKELLAPVKLAGGKLLCQVMKLSDTDESGRRGVVATGETVEVHRGCRREGGHGAFEVLGNPGQRQGKSHCG
jgi:putative selenate reductase